MHTHIAKRFVLAIALLAAAAGAQAAAFDQLGARDPYADGGARSVQEPRSPYTDGARDVGLYTDAGRTVDQYYDGARSAAMDSSRAA